jgi:uncharacterized protein
MDEEWRNSLKQWSTNHPHPSWGLAHAERVYASTCRLAELEQTPINEAAVFVAAYIHDIGALDPYRVKGTNHITRALQLLSQMQKELKFPKNLEELIAEIIQGHMFDAEPNNKPETILFHDADTLDFLGIIGITRMLAIVGKDDWTPNLSSAIKTIREFSEKLPKRLKSASAIRISRERVKDMQSFLTQLEIETDNLSQL